MAYTFSRVAPSSLTIEDVRPLIESSFQQILQNMPFPVEADTDAAKMLFLEQLVQPLLANPSIFIMKIMDDSLVVSYNIGMVADGVFHSQFTFLRANNAGSMLWMYRQDVSQGRYDFLTSEGVTHVKTFIPVQSNIPQSIDQLSCYQVETSQTKTVKPIVSGWTYDTFDTQEIVYLLVNPGV